MRAAIALNRFGLGAKPTDRPPSDPRGWLLGQLEAFEPSPRPIAAAIPASELLDNYQAVVQARRDRAATKREEGAAGAEPGEMATGEMATGMEMSGETGGRGRRTREERRARRRARREGRGGDGEGGDGEGGNLARLPGSIQRSASEARFASAVATDTPFPERLVHFWSNHFAVSPKNFIIRTLLGDFEFNAIRPNILGSFADLVQTVERHPAMLIFLDQYDSIGPNSPRGERGSAREGGNRGGFNENLAREILELHTLGVRSGYSEEDVRELARAMTGRTVAGVGGPGRGAEGAAGGYVFVPRIHEPGARTLLGQSFPDEGEAQAAAMIDYVARRPETARHIATKLARHFIADDPPPAAVSRIERAFIDSDGDLPTVYRALVESPEAWAEPFAKFKTPWDWLVSSWRGVDPDTPVGRVRVMLDGLGQPLWNPGSPAGFGDLSSDWLAPDAIMRRVETSQSLVQRVTDPVNPVALGETLLPGVLDDNTRAAISRADSPAQGMAMLLVAPEFLRR